MSVVELFGVVWQVSKHSLGAGFVAYRKLNTTPPVCAVAGELNHASSALHSYFEVLDN